MKKILLPSTVLLLLFAVFAIVTGFKNENEKDLLLAKINSLEKQLEAATTTYEGDPCTFNTVYSTQKLAEFLKNTQGKQGINAITMHSDSLKRMFNNVAPNNFKGPITIAFVHTSVGVELNLYNAAGGLLCGPGVCCPPRCRDELFGVLNIPLALPNGNKEAVIK